MKKIITLIVSCFSICLPVGVAQIPNYIPSSGLLAWYPFNGNANDAGPAAHHGTVTNGATLTTDRFNVANSAYHFDGIDDYIAIADNATNFRPQKFTIAAWALFETYTGGFAGIITKNVNGNTIYESLSIQYINMQGQWLCVVGSQSGTSTNYLLPNDTPTMNAWYHVIYQYDNINNIQKMYLNGVLFASAAVSSAIGYDNRIWSIGSQFENGPMSNFLNGKIDDLGIWDRVLTPCEIAQVYAASALTVSQSSSVICTGQTATLTASGANSYTWTNSLPGQSISVAPSASSIYTVTGTYANSVVCTATVMQNVSICAGIVNEEDAEEHLVNAYPNPVKDLLTLELSVNNLLKSPCRVTVFNSLGQMVLAEEVVTEHCEVDTRAFPKGIYFIQVVSDKTQQVIKFLKD